MPESECEMKYKCNECDTVFDESEARVLTTHNWNGSTTEMDTCPKCHSENLEEDYKEPAPEYYYDKEELRGERIMEGGTNG